MYERLYRRGQVEWALWKFSTLDLPSGDEPMSAFRARVRHLLQLDSSGVLFAQGEPPAQYVLAASGEGRGTGVDTPFTAFDAFCLAIALDLVRAGFKQREVHVLMAHLRFRLEGPFQEIIKNPPRFRSRIDRKADSSRNEESGPDRRVFLLIDRVEMSEAFPILATINPNNRGVIFSEPVLSRGIDELSHKLGKMDHLFRRAIVLEIAHMAARLAEFLDQAPDVKRGRPSSPFKRAYRSEQNL